MRTIWGYMKVAEPALPASTCWDHFCPHRPCHRAERKLIQLLILAPTRGIHSAESPPRVSAFPDQGKNSGIVSVCPIPKGFPGDESFSANMGMAQPKLGQLVTLLRGSSSRDRPVLLPMCWPPPSPTSPLSSEHSLHHSSVPRPFLILCTWSSYLFSLALDHRFPLLHFE